MNQRGLSIAETARQMRQHLAGEGFTATNLTHYRQGRSVPRPKYLEALSRVLEVDPSALTPEGTNTGGQSRGAQNLVWRLAGQGPQSRCSHSRQPEDGINDVACRRGRDRGLWG